jgi:hypothetical protein
MPASDQNASSTKANKGSSAKTIKPSHKFTSFASGIKPIDRYVNEYREYRSLAVGEYDSHQKAARAKHQDDLRDVVGREY